MPKKSIMRIIVIPLASLAMVTFPLCLQADHHSENKLTRLPGMPAWSEEQQKVADTIDSFWRAYTIEFDLEKAMGFFHDDFSGCYEGDVIPEGKEVAKQWFSQIAQKRETINFKSMPMSIKLTGDFAIVFELYRWTYRDKDGNEVYERGRFSGVWKKEDGRWLLFWESGGVDSTE